jgi:hypothetical protein
MRTSQTKYLSRAPDNHRGRIQVDRSAFSASAAIDGQLMSSTPAFIMKIHGEL